MTKTKFGILIGIIIGIIDVIPMIFQKLTWDANLSAFSLWIISGFLVANTSLKIKGLIKGTIISFLVLIPSAIIIGVQEPISLIPIVSLNLILGSILGFCIDKYREK